MKTTIRLVFVGVALLCSVAAEPQMQAVVPAPDGGYPGGNTAEGQNALFSLTIGSYNTAVGYYSLRSEPGGSFNTGVGAGTLFANVAGSSNTALGAAAGLSITGNSDICIGAGVTGAPNENNTIRIGDNLPSDTGQSACYIGGIYGQLYGANGTPCYVDPNGKLSVFFSARRFKTNIADMGATSKAVLALRPVTFHYKPELDKTATPQFGLVAEEVAAVNPDLVTRDGKGNLYTVRYEAVNAMLLNEFLKEHRKVQKLEAALQAVNARLKKQEHELQKVSAQIETSKAVPHVASKD